MRGLWFAMLLLTGCVQYPRFYRGVPLQELVQDFQLYSPKLIDLDQGLKGIPITARLNAPPFNEVETFVYGLPNFLPVWIEETPYSYHVHCLRSDCEWP